MESEIILNTINDYVEKTKARCSKNNSRVEEIDKLLDTDIDEVQKTSLYIEKIEICTETEILQIILALIKHNFDNAKYKDKTLEEKLMQFIIEIEVNTLQCRCGYETYKAELSIFSDLRDSNKEED